MISGAVSIAKKYQRGVQLIWTGTGAIGIIPPMHYVTESLLVGNVDDVQKPPPNTGGVLFLAAEFDVSPPPGIAFARVPLKEFGEADPQDVKQAVDWLEQQLAAHRVMVCCRAGMGRSVSIVMAYLCCTAGMSYGDAFQLLRMRRPGATPLPKLESTIQKVQELRRVSQNQSSTRHAAQTRPQKPDPR